MLLDSLSDTIIRFEQYGDEGVTGRLVNVQTDYASLFNDDQRIVHYPYDHIKSIRTNVTNTPRVVPIPKIELPGTFFELLESLILQPVTIEHGQESQTGVLSFVTDDNVCVVINTQEMMYYPLNQLKNITPVYKVVSESTGQDQSDTSGQNTSSDDSGTDTQSRKSAEARSNQGDTGKSTMDRDAATRVYDFLSLEAADRRSSNQTQVHIYKSSRSRKDSAPTRRPSLVNSACTIRGKHAR